MTYTFNSDLFLGLPAACNCKSLAAFIRKIRINRNTWSSWVQRKDVPLVQMLRICNLFDLDPAIFITEDNHDSNLIPIFRSRLFSNALSTFRNRTVTEACNCLGISTATFARQLRNTNGNEPSISVRTYLKWCELSDLNPLDYIYDGPVTLTFTD